MFETKLSKSAVIKFRQDYSGKDLDTYVFVRQLHSIVRHPIILNYKSKITAVRTVLGLSDYKFRKYINKAVEIGLAKFEGNHLRFWSNNQDRQYKPANKNDYYETNNPQLESKLMLVHKHIMNQEAEIRTKGRQTENRISNSAQPSANKPNYYTTLSIKSIKGILDVRSNSTAHKFKRELEARGLVKSHVRKTEITKEECKIALKAGDRNLRKIDGNYYRCLWYHQLQFDYKKVEHRPWMDLPDYVLNAYLDKGYSHSDIDRELTAI